MSERIFEKTYLFIRIAHWGEIACIESAIHSESNLVHWLASYDFKIWSTKLDIVVCHFEQTYVDSESVFLL